MLTTPVLNDIETFNAIREKTIAFNVVGGNQVVGNNLIIERVNDGVAVYNQTQDTFTFRHTIPAGTLANGVNYRARIRTKDINNNWSNFSANLLFWCFSEPNLNIITIDYENQNRVYNQTVLFETTYSQSEGEVLQSYRYLLYDSNKNLLQSFPEQFTDGSETLKQEIAGLDNGVLYHLEVKTLSPHGTKGTTGLIHFKPFYIAPQLSAAIAVENLTDQGAVKISTSISQVIFRLYDNNGELIHPQDVDYLYDDWIDMTRSDYAVLVGDGSLNTPQSDFILQLWCKNLPRNKRFLSFSSPYGDIELYKIDNSIRAYKTLNGLKYSKVYTSNTFHATSDDEIMVYLKQENEAIDLMVEVLGVM